MSRPTDEARYAQANRWMHEAFGASMPVYLTMQMQVPMTAAVRDVVAVISNSGARDLLRQWREEDVKSSAGVKAVVYVSGALALLLLHMRLGRVPHVVAIISTFHSLTARQRFDLGVDHTVDHLKSYTRIWEAIQRLIMLVDEFYIPESASGGRRKLLTGDQYTQVLEMRDPERCQRNRARMEELANSLVEGTMRLLPAEVLNRWEGNFAGDATVVAMLGKAGNPKDKSKRRRSTNFDAGYYGRSGTHAGYTLEDAKHYNENGKKIQGTSKSKLLWGIEAEIARMTQNVDNKTGNFPLLTVALGFHIPGAITGSGAALAMSLHGRGYRLNYCIFDRAYPSGFVRDFHAPIRLLGGKVVFDYTSKEFGVKGTDDRGFVQIVGSWYLDTIPTMLREIDKPMVDLRDAAKKPLSEIAHAEQRVADAIKRIKRWADHKQHKEYQKVLTEIKAARQELDDARKLNGPLIKKLTLAEATYAKKLEQREQYRLIPKGRMQPDGSRRYIVPDTSKSLLAKPQRFTAKTVTIEADITADENPGGLKHEQHLVYGTPLWRRVYGLRNGVESVNRNYKRSQYEDLQNPDRRHVRGNTFTYIIASIAAVCENIRKILGFLKEHLATRPVTAKNTDIPSIYWGPETLAEDTDPPPLR